MRGIIGTILYLICVTTIMSIVLFLIGADSFWELDPRSGARLLFVFLTVIGMIPCALFLEVYESQPWRCNRNLIVCSFLGVNPSKNKDY